MAARAVVFDWGGTITPWHDIDLVAQWYAYAEVYDPEHAGALARRLAAAEERRWQVQRESHGATTAGALEQLFLDEGIDTSSALHLRALAGYLDFWAPHTCAHPQVPALLTALRERGWAIGVLSNTMWPRAHHEEVFERDDLTALIDAALFTSEMPVAKPHAQAFEAILAVLGSTPEDSVFVGDRIWDDIAGAQRAGMRTIWIPHSRVPEEQVPDASARPDAVAHEPWDILGILESWV
jgi:putative hydrolase of the HAD superfamily